MTLRSRAILACAIALLPFTIAFAAAPAAVTGITAMKEGTGVRVTWNPVTGQTISAYRIFYSHASILQRNGAYDDFESTAGNATSFLLQNLPAGDNVYISVLAVNDRNEESPVFQEEAMVALRAGSASAPATATSAQSASHAMTQEAPQPAQIVQPNLQEPIQAMPPPDVLDLRLRAQAEQGGYSVHATWQAPTDPSIIALQILQTNDGGRTYGQPISVTPTTTTISIPRVPAGTFGLLVRSVANNQAVSNGVMQIITLPAVTNAPQVIISASQKQTQGKLPQSGPQVMLVALVAGFSGLLRYYSRKLTVRA